MDGGHSSYSVFDRVVPPSKFCTELIMDGLHGSDLRKTSDQCCSAAMSSLRHMHGILSDVT